MRESLGIIHNADEGIRSPGTQEESHLNQLVLRFEALPTFCMKYSQGAARLRLASVCVCVCGRVFLRVGHLLFPFILESAKSLLSLTYFGVIAVPWEALSQATGLPPCLFVCVYVCVCVGGFALRLCRSVGLLEKDTIVVEEAWKFGQI